MIYKNILWLLVSVSCFVGAALTACDDNDDSVAPTVNPPTDTTVHDSSVLDEAIRLDSLDLTMTERYGSPMYFYAQVDKSGDYFRRMFMDTTSFTVAAATGEIPDGAIIAMETWANESNQSTVFYRAKQDGQWLNGSFSPNRPDFSDAIDINSCRNCHQTASTTDFTFTRPLIQRSVRENTVQFIECDRGPTGPCDLEVYLGN
ncbi:MAG: cytochrome P460 family protein [Cyclobacteriaceae bacterium]